MAKNHQEVDDQFSLVAKVISIIAALSKQSDILQKSMELQLLKTLKVPSWKVDNTNYEIISNVLVTHVGAHNKVH